MKKNGLLKLHSNLMSRLHQAVRERLRSRKSKRRANQTLRNSPMINLSRDVTSLHPSDADWIV